MQAQLADVAPPAGTAGWTTRARSVIIYLHEAAVLFPETTAPSGTRHRFPRSQRVERFCCRTGVARLVEHGLTGRQVCDGVVN